LAEAMLSRRGFFLAGGALLGAPMLNVGRFSLYARKREYSRRTLDLVNESLVIDMLGLVTLDWDRLYRWQRDPSAFGGPDRVRLEECGINVFNPAVDLNDPNPFYSTQDWLRKWNRFIDGNRTSLLRVNTADDLSRAKRDKKAGIILGFQNADHFREPGDVAHFYSLGQRLSQVTYNMRNRLGCGCMAPADTGLTGFGASVIKEMNRLGMAVDVSHAASQTARDAIEVSKKPVLVTHSNCKALNDHPRCMSDDIIRLIAAKGGVFGITSIRQFVRAQEPVTIDHVLDHFDHAIRIAGIEHVGVGSDTDLEGRDRRGLPGRMDIEGLDNAFRMYELTEGLIRRGYSDANIRLILGGNFQRALKAIWTAPEAEGQAS